MPRQKANGIKRSQKGRRSHATDRKRKAHIPKREVPGRSGRSANPPADLVYRPDFLNYNFKLVSAFKVSSRYLDGQAPDKELIVELYKCLLKAPGFVDDKEWNDFPSLGELTEYLFSKLKTIIPKGYDWHFLRHYHNATYCIKYFKCRGDLYEGGMGMPLEWTELHKSHRLYECILYISYSVSKACGLDYIYNNWNDNFIYNPEDCYSGYPEDDTFIKLDVEKYQKGGEANIFYEACKKLVLKEDAADIHSKVLRFVPKTPFDKHLKKWLLKGIDLMQKPVKVYNFCYPYNDPDMDAGEPLMTNSLVCFEWSFVDNCFNETDNWKESIVNEIGQVEPVEHGYITPKEHVQPTSADELRELYKFFNIGRSMYTKFFEKTFNKKYDDRRKVDNALCARPSGGGV